MKTSVDYDSVLAAMLTRLQRAFDAILAIHRDAHHLNSDSSEMEKVKHEFEEANDAIFHFKSAWYEIQEAIRDRM